MSVKIKEPITKGVAKVPVVMQLEALECGAASLAMVLAYYGKWIPLEQVRYDCGVSRDGSNAKNVLQAARNYGLKANGYRFSPEALMKNGRFPCIIHWGFDHFVVLDGFRGGRACLNDPARGNVSVSMEEFDENFTGIVLLMEPGESFVPSGKRKSVWSFVAKRLSGAQAVIAFVVITTMITALLGLIRPIFSKIFIDRLLTGQNPGWYYPFLAALAFFSLIEIVVQSISALYTLKIDGKLAVIGSSDFFWKILHLPMEFFSQRMAGDIQERQESNASIAKTLVATLAPLVLETAMMVFYFVVMIRYSVLLTIICISSTLINMVAARVISSRSVNITRVLMRDAGKLAGASVSGIEMIDTIKASGAENGFFERWAGFQASVNTQRVQFAKTSTYLGLIPLIVKAVSDVLVLIIGVYMTMEGHFSVGMILAFQGFYTAFIEPAQSLISGGQMIQEMRTDMERLEDVLEYPDDARFSGQEETETEEESFAKLTGMIELKNITFGYSRLSEPLIRDFSMTLKPGHKVAFVGSSGCGKSTLSKLISGLYQPWSGEILFDGKPMQKINRSVFSGSLAVVDQDITLFEDTIADNIKMWDDSIEDFEMIMAARDAQLHQEIMERDGGYKYRITENGKDFSGGQRQRLEIARVLAQDPTIIILDEATSALDARTEYEVVKAIKDRGITCIVVAHRLSTIRDCDEIIVLDKGSVVERGTHEELFAQNGVYTGLVSNE